MLTLIYAVACSDVCGWFFSQTITLQTIMTAWPPGTGEGGGKLKYIHFGQGCKKTHVENKQRDVPKNTRENKQRDVPQTKNWPSTRQAVVYANSRSRIVVSSGRLPVSSANTFCIACQYFFVLSAILFAWSANTLRIVCNCFFRWSTFYKFFATFANT